MDGFGPSTGRFEEVCESSEIRLKMKNEPMPPVIGVLGIVAVVLGILFGATLIYENEEILGVILLIATVALVVLLVIWAVKARR